MLYEDSDKINDLNHPEYHTEEWQISGQFLEASFESSPPPPPNLPSKHLTNS